MKIIIVGAGVAGLSTYLQLRKLLPSFDSHTVVIYDSHKPPSRRTVSQSSASPLEASPSGPHVLTDAAAVVGNSIALAPRSVHLLGRIDSTLHDLFTARGYANEHFTFKTARGRVLAVTSTADARFPGERTISCPRHVLWECLHEVVGEDRVQHRQVASVDLDGPRPVVRFAEGGGQEEADLVIGADGVRSVVKRALFGEDDETRYAPRFE
ncbi:hypothetical protein VTK73DRAFT_1055 [Phialemonium thermophilum]|uniref:Uncharacterized protein n=1 Tax=Phialemonium thermophilum TaxID=223376 RepID=A0ABR3VTY2_9PEZI